MPHRSPPALLVLIFVCAIRPASRPWAAPAPERAGRPARLARRGARGAAAGPRGAAAASPAVEPASRGAAAASPGILAILEQRERRAWRAVPPAPVPPARAPPAAVPRAPPARPPRAGGDRRADRRRRHDDDDDGRQRRSRLPGGDVQLRAEDPDRLPAGGSLGSMFACVGSTDVRAPPCATQANSYWNRLRDTHPTWSTSFRPTSVSGSPRSAAPAATCPDIQKVPPALMNYTAISTKYSGLPFRGDSDKWETPRS